MIIRIGEEAVVNQKGTFKTTEVEVKIICLEGDEDNGMVTTPLTMTGITGIGMPMAKIIPTEAEDGKVIEARDIVTEGGGENGSPISNTRNRVTHNNLNTLIEITTTCHQWAINTNTRSHVNNTLHTLLQHQYSPQRPLAQSRQATNICQLCQNQGHYDYQCQFAGDFMAHTQNASNQGHSYNHQDPNQGDWSSGKNDNNDPNGQPFQ